MTRTASFHLKHAARIAVPCLMSVVINNCVSLESGKVLPPGEPPKDGDASLNAGRDAATDRGRRDRDAAPNLGVDAAIDRGRKDRDAALALDAGSDAAADRDAAMMADVTPADRPEAAAADEDAGESAERSMLCPDHATAQCSQGVWPNGVIQYAFAADYTERASTRAAMDRWEDAAAHVIRFVEAPDAAAKVTFRMCGQGGGPVGYDACVNGCDVALCAGSVHHALGRVIGLWPEQRRFDRDRYVRVLGACDVPELVDRCATPDSASDFGPFDYGSSMFSFRDSGRISRWNGQPLCSLGQRCAVSTTDSPPSTRDGSAVIERYQLATHWSKFRRMLDQTAPEPYAPLALTPFTDEVSRTSPIAANASPALETWVGETLAIYVRAADDTILKEWWDAKELQWAASAPLLKVPGLGDVSDPAVASWKEFRNDTVVRRGGTIYITSEQVQMPWESLGSPAAVAASSPAITTWGENRLDVVVRAQDNRIYHKACSASCSGSSGIWSEWVALAGATVRGKPAIVSRGPGLLDVFAHGTDDRVWTIAYAMGSWGTWSALPVSVPLLWDPTCADCSSPSAGARTSSSLDVFVRGADNRLWSASWSADTGWAEFVTQGGDLASSPASSSTLRDVGQADVVVIMTEDHGGSEPYRAPWWKSYRAAAQAE